MELMWSDRFTDEDGQWEIATRPRTKSSTLSCASLPQGERNQLPDAQSGLQVLPELDHLLQL